MVRSSIAALAVAFSLSVPSEALHAQGTPGTVVEVAVEAGTFTTLVAAVQAAGLVDVLNGEGPFTVFAPSDEAFAKIPPADLEAILADRDLLTAILTYHVVPGRVAAAEVVDLTTAPTVNGKDVRITTNGGVVQVDGAQVVATDIHASNGIIHVIDTVIIP